MTTKSELYIKRTESKIVASGNPAVPVGNSSVTMRSMVNTVTYGENLKDWRQRIADGRSATTSLDGVRYVISTRPFEHMYGDGLGRKIYITGTTQQFEVVTSPSDVLVNLATAKARQAFAKKVRAKMHTFQGGVAAGEFRESVRLLASPTRRLRNSVDDLLSDMFRLRRQHSRLGRKPGSTLLERIVKNPASLRNAIADTWLQWSFGAKPLISDCQDAWLAMQKMSKGVRDPTLRFKGIGTEERFVRERSYFLSMPSPAAASVRVTERITEQCEVTIRGAYRYRRPDGNFPLPALFGVDLSSWAPTAWELIPWSFLVDYFTDVGSAIDAMSIRFVDLDWTNVTTRSSTKTVLINPEKDASWATAFEFWCPHPYIAKGVYTEISRRAGLGDLLPYIPQFEVPLLKDKKWLNVAALLNSVLALKR